MDKKKYLNTNPNIFLSGVLENVNYITFIVADFKEEGLLFSDLNKQVLLAWT